MKLKLFIIALLALFVASCTREVLPDPVDQGEKIVTINATIPGETRVAYEDVNRKLTWEENDQLLLAGCDANGNYIGESSLFTWTGNGNSFSGIPVTGADTYKAYYPASAITLDSYGNLQLNDSFLQQTQDGDGSTAHLSGKLLLIDEIANPLSETFVLELKSNILKFVLSGISSDVGTITKLIWTVESTTGGKNKWLLLNVTGVSPGTTSLTAYLAYAPAAMRIAPGDNFKILLIGDKSYVWRKAIPNGKTYSAGNRYTATVTEGWTQTQAIFRYTIKISNTSEDYKIMQRTTGGTSPANLVIDWGDGSSSTPINKDVPLPNRTIASHTYNTGTYTITIISDQEDPSQQQIPQLIFYNSDGTYGDGRLTTILDPFPNMGANATDFTNHFHGCTQLTSIPAELFRYNSQGTNFGGCFINCTQLASVPSDLFKYNSQVFNFDRCFENCNQLDSIPAELFRYNTQVTNFEKCFQYCTKLTSIPAELFRYNSLVTNFERCFFRCGQLDSIPAELFRYNTQATNFVNCFHGCTKLTSIPAELFRYNTQATNFGGCFYDCSQLDSIPADLFRYNTQVFNFDNCFYNCTKLTSIPAELFRYNTLVTNFAYCFRHCTRLASIPADLFRYNTLVTNFLQCFDGCVGLTTVPAGLFHYNTAATVFRQCFLNCSLLVLIPEIFPDPTTNNNFFAGRAMNFESCFQNVGTNSATPGTAPRLWEFYHTAGLRTTNCFTGATTLTNYNNIPSAWGGGGI
ncbi:MAG TPA: hypothetical protein PL115_00185 [Bacteroidales bacterium]|nr:hypothetical protein [Bacteroidales bacterium]HPY21398.1 hypothetical protein [Bacteroidales bacterium]HQA92516.1 hypothetical protein [Bacteroidales bacterium]HQN23325.1 hypothetical protein [Bacteroidales bacterium]HQP78261.1 hypothetical protein [Bacteroidales bacterium]